MARVCREGHRTRTKNTRKPGRGRGRRGTSQRERGYELGGRLQSKNENGWEVGYEKATQMVVRRKGRGVFRFEKAMMEGTGVGLRDEEYGGIESAGEEEVKSRTGKLEDGFEYRVWTGDDVVVS
jgi:hypothetical protein